jgi:hypothetical protein
MVFGVENFGIALALDCGTSITGGAIVGLKFKLGVTSAVALSLCLAANAGYAKSGQKGKSGNATVEYEAELEPAIVAPATVAIEPDAEGEAKYKKQIHKGTPKTERFEAKVKIPFPSTALGIIDEATAQNADIQLLLSSLLAPTTFYAACAMDLTEIETELEDGVTKSYAVYKVDVRKEVRNGATRNRQIHGICDTDSVTTGVQSGTPMPNADDIATAVLVTTTAPIPPATDPTISYTYILTGSFELD